jgi:hypothetical protein
LKSESFLETYIPEVKEPPINYSDITNLKERFNRVFDSVKRAAKQHEDYFSKLSITASDSSMLKEEKPIIFEPKPIEAKIHDKVSFDNLLQTSLLNINDEIKDNNISFESDVCEKENNIYNKLRNVREKLIKENSNVINLYTISKRESNDTNKYKDMLNRVREKSQEQTLKRKDLYVDQYDSDEDRRDKRSELRVSAGCFEIKGSNSNNNMKLSAIMSPVSKVNTTHRFKLDEDEKDLISILNSNIYSNRLTKRDNNPYNDNLIDLIEEIESTNESCLAGSINNSQCKNKIKINLDTEKM